MNHHPRILFVHNSLTTFVRYDLEILREAYQVTEFFVSKRQPGRLGEIPSLLRTHDLVYGWFASWHTFIPTLMAKFMKKPTLLVVGGYDLACLPEIGYGHQRGGIKKWVSRWTMRLATRLVTNAHFSRNEAARNAGIPVDRIRVIYHGLSDPFSDLSDEPRESLALTVGRVDFPNLFRKGHEPFVRAASYLPDMNFTLVGVWADEAIDHLRSIAPANVHFTGWIDEASLLNYYQTASVYVQASLHEGFGMSLAEAMLGGCIPVATCDGALTEVVDDCGIYVDSQDPTELATAIHMASNLSYRFRSKARQRVLDHFSLEKRASEIFKTLEELIYEEH